MINLSCDCQPTSRPSDLQTTDEKRQYGDAHSNDCKGWKAPQDKIHLETKIGSHNSLEMSNETTITTPFYSTTTSQQQIMSFNFNPETENIKINQQGQKHASNKPISDFNENTVTINDTMQMENNFTNQLNRIKINSTLDEDLQQQQQLQLQQQMQQLQVDPTHQSQQIQLPKLNQAIEPEIKSEEQKNYIKQNIVSEQEKKKKQQEGQGANAFLYYSQEIIPHLKKIERAKITIQKVLVVDWLSASQVKGRFTQQTLFLTVNLLYRYLALTQVEDNQQQLYLIALACFYIAIKLEEVNIPTLDEFVKMHNKRIPHKSQLLDLEGNILLTLNFNLTQPNSLTFFQAFKEVTDLDDVQNCFCNYLIELSQVYPEFLKYPPSMIAAGTILVAEKLKNLDSQNVWSSQLQDFTQYKQSDIQQCGNDLYISLIDSNKTSAQNIIKKYSSNKYRKVSLFNYEIPAEYN